MVGFLSGVSLIVVVVVPKETSGKSILGLVFLAELFFIVDLHAVVPLDNGLIDDDDEKELEKVDSLVGTLLAILVEVDYDFNGKK